MFAPTTADEIARSLADEVVRENIVALLDQRWRKALTLVTAPGGYGKTRALAQAVRSNQEDPVGVEFYLRLRSGHVDPARLASSILEAIGASTDQLPIEQSMLDRIIDEFASFSPTRVVVILDDVHLVSGSPDAVALLAGLIRLLPTNSHLVLAGRRIPELPLARLHADDEVIEVTEADLVFGADEIEALANRHGVDHELLTQLAGWPALVRLAVVAGKAGPQEFLMQEIVHELAPELVQGVIVASLAGLADQTLFERCGVAVSPEQVAEHVPLMDAGPSGAVRSHDLWTDVVADLADREQIAGYVDEIAPWHSDNWRHDEAIQLAVTHGTNELARRVLMDALDASDLRLHPNSTGRWLDLFGGSETIGDDPELLLLRGWHQRLSNGPGHGDDDVTAALALFYDRGDALGEARASVEHAFRGFLAGDVGPVIDAVERSRRLVKSGIDFLQPLGEMTNSIIAELSGDFTRSLAHSQRAIRPGIRREFAELCLRHRSTLYFLVGDGDAAVETVQELVEYSHSTANEVLLAYAQFANADIDAVLEKWDEIRYFETSNIREDFTFAVASIFIDACLGFAPDLTLVRRATWERPRERMQLALCEWSAEIIAGNEAAANESLRAEITALGLDDPLVVGEIRRFVVSGYVAVPEVRAYLDELAEASELGGYHLERLRLARILVALRDGAVPEWDGYLGPAHVISSMALPWAVEVACGLVLHDEERGVEFADALFTATGARTQTWLRALADSDAAVAAGARQLLSILPAPPGDVTSIGVHPFVSLTRGGETTPVSRVRVRQLLLLLVMREPLSRDQAMTLLWPDKDLSRARNNLRITLSHLRDELEPGRQAGQPSYHVRQRGNEIVLRRSEYLAADLWVIGAGLAAAEATLAGDRSGRLAALAPVADLWQPPLLPDLEDLPDVSSEVGALQARLRDATVEVAEAYLSGGQYDDAERLGRKLLIQDRFYERAHAIMIAAYLGADQEAQAHQAIDDCLVMLADLDVPPAAATRMLLRRARDPEDASLRSA